MASSTSSSSTGNEQSSSRLAQDTRIPRMPAAANHQGSSSLTAQEQCRSASEAIYLYGYAEKAALKIQKNFRERQRIQKEMLLSETDDEKSEASKGSNNENVEEDEGNSGLITLVFIALFTIGMTTMKWIGCCAK
eukprot:scaffold26369_cov201-Cylindrotheca_fusiformis.AAC.2